MKKGFIILLLLIIPNILYATCDINKHNESINDAKNISYTIDYSTSSKKFSVTFENIEDMYATYNDIKYIPEDNTFTIKSISEGNNITVKFYGNDGCSNEIEIKKISIPYYNTYYKNSLCEGYEDILTMCNSQFTTVKVTKELLKLSIDNYNNMRIPVEKDEEEEITLKTLLDKVKEFTNNWGIKILLVVGSSTLTIIIGSSLYRKELHGV